MATSVSVLTRLYLRKLSYLTFCPFQEDHYPRWSPALRRFWRRGRNRVYAFWFISFSMSAVVATAITTDYLNWDEISRDFMPTNELSRAFLASFILVMDLFIVMQVQLIPLKKGQENISRTFPRLFTISIHSCQNF